MSKYRLISLISAVSATIAAEKVHALSPTPQECSSCAAFTPNSILQNIPLHEEHHRVLRRVGGRGFSRTSGRMRGLPYSTSGDDKPIPPNVLPWREDDERDRQNPNEQYTFFRSSLTSPALSLDELARVTSTSRISHGKSRALDDESPCLLTNEYVYSLRVVDLKQACADRGLLKKGRKTDLQERLLRWVQTQQQSFFKNQTVDGRKQRPSLQNTAPMNKKDKMSCASKTMYTSKSFYQNSPRAANAARTITAAKTKATNSVLSSHEDYLSRISSLTSLQTTKDSILKGLPIDKFGQYLRDNNFDKYDEDIDDEGIEEPHITRKPSSKYISTLNRALNTKNPLSEKGKADLVLDDDYRDSKTPDNEYGMNDIGETDEKFFSNPSKPTAKNTSISNRAIDSANNETVKQLLSEKEEQYILDNDYGKHGDDKCDDENDEDSVYIPSKPRSENISSLNRALETTEKEIIKQVLSEKEQQYILDNDYDSDEADDCDDDEETVFIPKKSRSENISTLKRVLKTSIHSLSEDPSNNREEQNMSKINEMKDVKKYESLRNQSSSDIISNLNHTFSTKNNKYSNRELKRMYSTAKYAEQAGDIVRARKILEELEQATPFDGRVTRRLSRMALDIDGDVSAARKILQKGLNLNPENAHLWHGLGHLDFKLGNKECARRSFTVGLKVMNSTNCHIPNLYHSWALLEEGDGHTRRALRLLKHGLKHSPKNHRLYHALGNVYRRSGLYNEADEAFQNGMKCGPPYAQSFFLSALANAAYDSGNIDKARKLLRQSVTLNRGMHSQGWLALAQLEEAEGTLSKARATYRQAVDKYEDNRNIRKSFRRKNLQEKKMELHSASSRAFLDGSISNKDDMQIIPRQSGDKWFAVYDSWADMEMAIPKNFALTNNVFSRAVSTFPENWRIDLKWAQMMVAYKKELKADIMFRQSCEKAGHLHADPYRVYAEFAIRTHRIHRARRIFLRGAQHVVDSSDDPDRGLSSLFHSWALCEWKQFKNFDRSRKLFENSLRLTENIEHGALKRALFLTSFAHFEFSRGNYRVAQHCVCLAIHDHGSGGSADCWKLWSNIATKLDDKALAAQCTEQANLIGIVDCADNLTSSADLPHKTNSKYVVTTNELVNAPWNLKMIMKRRSYSCGEKGDYKIQRQQPMVQEVCKNEASRILTAI